MQPDPGRLADLKRLKSLKESGLLDSPPEEAFDRVVRMAAKLLKVPVVLISLVEEQRQFFKSALGLAEPYASQRQTPISHSFCQYTVMTGEALEITDARSHPWVKDNPAIQDLGVAAYLGIPLLSAEQEYLGALCAIDHQPRQWNQDERQSLQDLALWVMNEIRLRSTDQRLRQQSALLQAVLNSMDDVVIAFDQQGALLLSNPAAERVIGKNLENLPPEKWLDYYRLFADQGETPLSQPERPLMRAFKGETLSRLEVFAKTQAFPQGCWHSLHTGPLLDAQQQQIGALMVARDISELKALQQKLESMSLLDELTGLYNRRGFRHIAEQQMHLAGRNHQHLCLVYMDLDGMKSINDEFGHETGDQALQALAQVLQQTFRQTDVLARIGGDEFVALAIDADDQERLQKRLQEKLNLYNAQSAQPFQLRLSVGLRYTDPESDETLEQLLSHADEEMYQQKRQHRADLLAQSPSA